MKTKLFFFAMLVGVVASAQTLNVKIIKIDYSTKIATCDLSWTGRNATHLSDVWVFVDYIEISGNAPAGSWKPAAITGATVTQKTTGNAIASTVSGNTRGVWIKSVTSGANFTGQITLQLSGVSAKFNACAYATDYPPNIASVSSGTYTLKGTQSFKINGTSISGNQYAGTVNALIDLTGCPGCLAIRDLDRSSANVNIPCCPNLATVGNYCRDLVADAASTFTGCGIEIKAADAGTSVWSPDNLCPAGWRWPSASELSCIITNRTAVGGLNTIHQPHSGCGGSGTNCGCCDYWTSQSYNSTNGYYVLSCAVSTYPAGSLLTFVKKNCDMSVRCVRD